ncbi:Mitochondrial transcription termination factor family protein [Euphorbia peplus]|nr:Mitochondrial transcription termination factor family protein [Euphorbia peplus]
MRFKGFIFIIYQVHQQTPKCRFRLSILGLKNVFGPNFDIFSFLKNSWHAGVLMSDLERTFVPNIEYLKSCGISSSKLASSVARNHCFFHTKLDKLKGLVQRVDEMGVDRKSKTFLQAVVVMGCLSKESWELKLKNFRDLGFSEQNILHAFAAEPQAFTVSERKMKEVTQLLLSVKGFSISDIVCNPKILCYSVEKRFKPRLRVLKALENQNLLKKKPGLVNFFTVSDAVFRNKYAIPCIKDEVGDLFAS